MKRPPYTTEPLVGNEKKAGIKELLLGHLAGDAYYEAHREDNGVYILWMEFSRFGLLSAYPCVLAERDETPMVFRSYDPADSGGNNAMFDRWRELVTPESFHSFRVNKLSKSAFQEIFRAYREGKA